AALTHLTHRYTNLPFFVVTRLRPPSPTLFPYTTLFRSSVSSSSSSVDSVGPVPSDTSVGSTASVASLEISETERTTGVPSSALRSEEHTSELQSRENLVCRLLLEKKNDWSY